MIKDNQLEYVSYIETLPQQKKKKKKKEKRKKEKKNLVKYFK